MRIVNTRMLSSAAAVAVIAAMPSAALAFDAVNWTWDKTVTEAVDIDIDVNAVLEPTGLTQVEKAQIQIGDVRASSAVRGILNNQPVGDGGGVGVFNEVFNFNATTDDDFDPSLVLGPVDGVSDDGDSSGVSATLLDGGTLDEGADDLNFQVEVSGEIIVDPTDSFDAALNLPSIESAATAVGNNQSITSDVGTYLHDGQFLFDVQEEAEFGTEDLIGGLAAIGLGSEFIDNSHTAFAVGATVLGITGTIEKAQVSSVSSVSSILNSRVDSGATSVGNNVSVDVNPAGAPDANSILVADMTQFALADIFAASGVSGVGVNNYTNLAAVNPLVSSAATAVGNNVSINVGNVGGL